MIQSYKTSKFNTAVHTSLLVVIFSHDLIQDGDTTEQGGTASRYRTLLDGRPGGIKGVSVAVLLLVYFHLTRPTDLRDTQVTMSPTMGWRVTTYSRDAKCSDFIGSFPIFAYPFRYYDYIELSSDFLGDLIIIFLVHFISRLLVEHDDFLESI